MPQDHLAFLERICSSKEQAENICSAIQRSSVQIKLLLRTPLLLTLLTLLYKSEESIPENLIDFYDKLFYILYTRHDSTKPGFKREIKSELSERKFEEVFEAFCFISRKSEKVALTRREAIDIAEHALNISEEDCDESHFIDDCCKVACMLIEEGMDYHFIHKSVQEFYCARFISKRSDDFVKPFYDHAVQNLSEWQQEIYFLETLDKLRAAEYFKIPAIEKIIEEVEEKGCEYILDGNIFFIDENNEIESLMTASTGSTILYYKNVFLDSIFDEYLLDFMSTHQELPSEIAKQAKDYSRKVKHSLIRGQPKESESFPINAFDLLRLMKKDSDLISINEKTLKMLNEDLESTRRILENERKLTSLSF